MRDRAAVVMAANVLMTLVMTAALGPAAFKLEEIGLVGWAARAPFFLQLLCIGPAVLVTRGDDRPLRAGVLAGSLLGAPLALWSAAVGCAPHVTLLYLAGAAAQGLVLALLARGSATAWTTPLRR